MKARGYLAAAAGSAAATSAAAAIGAAFFGFNLREALGEGGAHLARDLGEARAEGLPALLACQPLRAPGEDQAGEVTEVALETSREALRFAVACLDFLRAVGVAPAARAALDQLAKRLEEIRDRLPSGADRPPLPPSAGGEGWGEGGVRCG